MTRKNTEAIRTGVKIVKTGFKDIALISDLMKMHVLTNTKILFVPFIT